MIKHTGLWATRGVVFVLMAHLVTVSGCGVPTFLSNYTTSLGGNTVGGRGALHAMVVNNTPFFASFTIGAFDALNDSQTLTGFDPSSPAAADYYQFFADPAFPQFQPLERDTTSQTFAFTCARGVSLGDRDLIQAIRERDPNAKLSTLQEGITFSDKIPTDPTAQKFTLNGVANQVQLLGVNYQCESLVVFTFQPDDTQPFGVRIDAEVILP